ncbi:MULTISPECIES: TetR/AcrR family transcriptional regulator [unclassified Nocardioides]|uniref:TetR/AcrR family transcriptional regulator n=1 Tax=unclassified Nocardioides TaxID=2615069 RepID=UPI0006FF1059|nr:MULTISPECIES: TetR/AcrR family transcriptional regulator [unclassified Nocardioides]KQY51599.1 transcriptional regulator [Nocardioides sp. Root140]KRF10999.1 transcriptional regulator [Nocardioides sp. Soil796]
MSTGYVGSGRTNQKQRTRDALVRAARDLIARGGDAPTIEEAANEASISRTTAYRYFPTQRDLLVAAHPEVAASSLLPDGIGNDPVERLDAAVAEFTEMIAETETQQRTMLRLSLESATDTSELPLRQGRAVGWFAEALSVLVDDLGEDGVRRLAVAIRSAVGIEARVWLIDVAGLAPAEATDVLRSNARAILQQAMVTTRGGANG